MAVSIGRRAVVPLVLALAALPACSGQTSGHGSALGSRAAAGTTHASATTAAPTTHPSTTSAAPTTHRPPRHRQPGKPLRTLASRTAATHPAPTTTAARTTPPPTTTPAPTTPPRTTTAAPTHTSAPPPKPQHTLEFDLTGDGVLTTMTYVVNGQSTTLHSVHMPWQKSFPLTRPSGQNTWSLHTEQASGSVFSKVLVDGQVVTQGSGVGPGSGDLSGSV